MAEREKVLLLTGASRGIGHAADQPGGSHRLVGPFAAGNGDKRPAQQSLPRFGHDRHPANQVHIDRADDHDGGWGVGMR